MPKIIKNIIDRLSEKEYLLNKKLHQLQFVGWECTKQCNLNCLHCYMSAENKKSADEVNTKKIKKTFFNLKKCCQPSKVYVSITGGEPLIRKDLLEIASFLKNLGFNWILTTNATLINNELAKKITKNKPVNISISIDGTKNSHNYLRNNKHAYDQTILGINNLIKSGYKSCDIIIKTLINPKNIDNLEELYKILLKLKIGRWHLLTPIKLGRAANNFDKLNLSETKFNKIKLLIKKVKVDGKIKIVFNEGEPLLEYNQELIKKKQCLSGINFFSILYNGDVIGCVNSFRNPRAIQGNIKKDNVCDIWNNKFQINRSNDWHGCGIHNLN